MADPICTTEPSDHHGIVVPMITPITDDGELDVPGVRRVIDYMIEGGVDGIFVLGTTGESMSVPYTMRSQLVSLLVDCAGGRAKTYAGISGNILAQTVSAAEEFFDVGVDAVVAHTPFYYPLTESEILAYFTMLAYRISGPLMLYNMPSTTGISIPLNVVEQLSDIENIVGLKDSERDIERQQAAVKLANERDGFSFFTGVASYSALALQWGADGAVPSSGNLVPELCSSVYRRSLEKDWVGANDAQAKMDVVAATYQAGRNLGQSLAGLKCAMNSRKICGTAMLPPLTAMNAAEQAQIQQALAELEVI